MTMKSAPGKGESFLSGLLRHQIVIPLAALLLLAIFNLIADPSFFRITFGYNSAGNPVFKGYPITIIDYGTELAILAIGMTLVTAASGGQDISVGAAIAIAGSVILRILCGFIIYDLLAHTHLRKTKILENFLRHFLNR